MRSELIPKTGTIAKIAWIAHCTIKKYNDCKLNKTCTDLYADRSNNDNGEQDFLQDIKIENTVAGISRIKHKDPILPPNSHLLAVWVKLLMLFRSGVANLLVTDFDFSLSLRYSSSELSSSEYVSRDLLADLLMDLL